MPRPSPPATRGNRSRPLGPALQFLQLLWAVAHGLESTSKRMHATLGITGPQRLVVRLVGHHGSLSAGELAQIMHIDPSSLTGVLRRLQELGLLNRRNDPRDARRAVLTLTAKGRRINSSNAATVEAAVERALRGLPHRELRAAQRALQALADALEEE